MGLLDFLKGSKKVDQASPAAGSNVMPSGMDASQNNGAPAAPIAAAPSQPIPPANSQPVSASDPTSEPKV